MKRRILYSILCLLLLTGCSSKNEYVSYKETAKKDSVLEVQRRDEEKLDEEKISVKTEPLDEKKEKNTTEKEDETRIEKTLNQQLDTYLNQMTIEEKIGQLFMIAIRKDENGIPITTMSKKIREIISNYHVGGIILFNENIETKEQTQTLIKNLQDTAHIPLFIGVDEEGGIVSRVGKKKAINKVPFKEAYAIGQTGDTSLAYKEARRMGAMLNELGFNMDFAPVADIYNEPSNQVIGKRSFGKTSTEVVPMVLAFSKGLLEENIQPVVKHFPGHGNTIEDSHQGIAYVHKDLVALEEEELLPFRKAIEEGVGAIMKGHLLVPAVDETTIVSLSDKWNSYMESQFDLSDTLVMTDAMDMGAVIKNYGSGEAACLSLMAGNDILLMPYDLEKAYEGILKAYEEGRISKERIETSVRKILSKKVAQKILVLA